MLEQHRPRRDGAEKAELPAVRAQLGEAALAGGTGDDPPITRRRLLAGLSGGLAVLAVSACSARGSGQTATPRGSGGSGGAGPGNLQPSGSFTVADLLADSPFYIAHRGSGDNWTEHSMRAYEQSIAHGVKAIEVSVRATSDGELVCFHDADLERMTGSSKLVSKTSYADIESIRLNARQWLGPNAPLEPMPRLKDVLDRFAATRVIFIEDKQGTNTSTLLALMDSYPHAVDHFVWKQRATADHAEEVRARGYTVWGYFDVDMVPQFDRLVPRFDLVGLYHQASDDDFRRLVAHGKPVICWEIHDRSMRDRVHRLGVRGMMCSNVAYVPTPGPDATCDAFGSGLRAAGDLPWVVDKGWGVQPKIQPDQRSLRVDVAANASYVMGSMCPVRKADYALTARVRWPSVLPPRTSHAGIAFGQTTDAPYRVYIPSEVSGYHLIVRPDGEIVLFARRAGQVSGSRLASLTTRPVTRGEWVSLRITVGPRDIHITRTDGPQWATAVTHPDFRGGYFSLCKNDDAPIPVEFDSVCVR